MTLKMTWMCAACGKVQKTAAGCAMRFVLGARQRVCAPCKDRK